MRVDDDARVYEVVGGQVFFDALVDRFYATVAADPVLRPMYPEDLSTSKAHLAGFLAQYWGGPPDYSDARGHPRLRMRHAPFTIDVAARDAWFRAMADAVLAADLAASLGDELGAEIEARLLEYFAMAATHMVNTVAPTTATGGPHITVTPTD